MTGVNLVGFETWTLSSKVSSKVDVSSWHSSAKRGSRLYAAVLTSVVVLVAGLGIAPGWAQETPSTPEAPLVIVGGDDPVARETATVIAPPGALCPELVGLEREQQIPSESGAEDLLFRCRELVQAAPDAEQESNVRQGLRAMAQEEVTSLGTTIAELPQDVFADISARLAALRGGATGLVARRFALHLDEPARPGTLVASLFPVAAVSSAVPANVVRRFGIFVTSNFGFGEKDATLRESGFDFDTFDITGGVDYKFTNNLIFGVAGGYRASDVDLDGDGGGLDARGFNVSAYGTYYIFKQFFIEGIASFGWDDYDIDRAIRYSIPERLAGGMATGRTLNVNQVARGETDSIWYAISVGAGYELHAGSFTFGPFGRVNYTKADIDGYQEEIDNRRPGFGLILAFDDQEIESLTTVLGGEVSYALSTPWGVLVPQARFEWEHEFKNDARTIRTNFVFDPTPTDPSPGTPEEDTHIDLRTDDPDRDFFNLGIGLAATFRAGFSAFVYYETTLGLEDITVHNIAFGVRKEL